MGAPMVGRLLAAGVDTTVYARRAEVREELARAGAMVTAGLSHAVRDADVVVTCLYSDAQLLEVALGPAGLLATMMPGSILVVHTTGSPATARSLAEAGAPRDVHVVDAPVSGGAVDIAQARLTVMLGGAPADIERVKPVIAAYADPIFEIGALGSAQGVKLLNNALFAANVQLVAEAERVANELGVDTATLARVVQHSSGASYVMGLLTAMDSIASLVEVAGHFLRKDIDVVTDVARGLGVDLGLLGDVAERGPAQFVGRSSPGAPHLNGDAMTAEDMPVPSLQMLWDIEQIKQLKARYFRLLDAKDWDAFAELFTEDCEHHLPSESPIVMHNEEYFANLKVQLGNGVTTHHGHMPEITLLGPRDAEGIWAMFDFLEVEPEGGTPLTFQGYGHYHETYRRGDDGQWRISSKRNIRQRIDPRPRPD